VLFGGIGLYARTGAARPMAMSVFGLVLLAVAARLIEGRRRDAQAL